MNPLLVTFCIFSMSLFGALMLFKVLKNTAVVKLPLGQFGGAIAGFIVIFFILGNEYSKLGPEVDIHLNVPSGFASFVSKDLHLGFVYPKELNFNDRRDELSVLGDMPFPTKKYGNCYIIISSNKIIANANLPEKELTDLYLKNFERLLLQSNRHIDQKFDVTDIVIDGKAGKQIKAKKYDFSESGKYDLEETVLEGFVIDFKNHNCILITANYISENKDLVLNNYLSLLSAIRFF